MSHSHRLSYCIGRRRAALGSSQAMQVDVFTGQSIDVLWQYHAVNRDNTVYPRKVTTGHSPWCTVIKFCVLFRGWAGVHCIPRGRHPPSRVAIVVLPFLLHVTYTWPR